MLHLRREHPSRKRFVIETLELRTLLSAAFDIAGLTALRNNFAFAPITGQGVGIAVLDTGVDAKNPDLAPNVVAFYNAVENPITASTLVANAVDNDGHGTHVSGIAASSNKSIGVAYGAKLVDIKVLADSNEAELGGDPVLRGLIWVADNYQTYNIKVVNMSLGESGVNENSATAADAQDAEAREIKVLEAAGITVVSASGNSYAQYASPGESFPAIVSTIGAANTWATTGVPSDFNVPFGDEGDQFLAIDTAATPDTFNSTSQRSTSNNQIAAPGTDIYSDWNGTPDFSNGSDLLHNTISGTSMSAPFVSGVVALMQNAAKYFGGHYLSDPNQILQILQQTADTVVDSNNPNNLRYDSSSGFTTNLPETGFSYKRIDVLKAIQAVQALVTGGSVTVGAAPGPDTDNTTTTATPVNNIDGTNVYDFDGSIGTDGLVQVTNDVDLYKLDVVSPGDMTCMLSLPGGGTAFAAALRLFDSSGNVVVSTTGTAGSYPTLTTMAPLAIGTYYLGISSVGNQSYTINGTGAANGTAMGDYAVQITLSNPDPNGTIQGAVSEDLTEPNETLQDPITGAFYSDILESGALGSDPPPTGGSVRISVNSDVDMYEMTAPDNGKLSLSAIADPGNQTFLEIFDSNANVLASSDSTNSPIPGENDLSIQLTAGQTYFVAITVPQNLNFVPSNPYQGRTANVTLTDQNYDLHFRFDNNDIDGTANSANTNVVIGTTVNGNIGQDAGRTVGATGSKDVDWYGFTATNNGFFNVVAQGLGNSFTPLITLWTLTADQSNIVKVADSSSSSLFASPASYFAPRAVTVVGGAAQLIYQVTAGETIFVAVTGPGNGNFNWYSIASGTGAKNVGVSGSNYQLTTQLNPLASLSAFSNSAIQNGTPQNITVGQTINGNLGADGALVVGPNDIDIFKLVAPATQTLDIKTNTSAEGSADTVLRFFDASGNQITADDNIDATTSASEVEVSVQAGQTYYIGVDGAGPNAMSYNPITGANAGNGSTGNYALIVQPTAPGFAINTPTAVNAFTGGTMLFTVTLDQSLATQATVDYATADGTAVAGTDYSAETGTLTFPPGVTTQTVAVPVLANMNLSQNNLTFMLMLSNAQGAQISRATATGTIQNVAAATLTFSNKKPAAYINSLGKHVQLMLSGPGAGTAIFVNNELDPTLITLNNTTGASTFSVHGGVTLLGNITVNGSLFAITANTVTLNGSINVTGSLVKLTLNNVSGGASGGSITTGAAAAPMAITLGLVSNESLSTPGSIAQLKVGNWLNSSAGTITISAAAIGVLASRGDFAPSITAQAIGTATISKSLSGGTWSISGSAKSLTVAGAVTGAWNASFTGGIASVRFGSDSGHLTAGSIANLRVTGGVANATLNLTSAGTDLGTVMVGKDVLDSQIITAGNVGNVSVGAFDGSDLLAGVGSAVTGLPAQTSDFIASDSILSFTVKATAAPFSFSNSTIAAASIGKIMVARVNASNNSTPFGFAAESIASVTNKGVLKWKSSDPVSQLVADGDFVVRIVT